jgi:hypothetical protein
MSLQKYVPALQIDLQPSRYLLAFILISHVGALVLLFFLPVALWIMLLLGIAILFSLYRQWRDSISGYKSLRWDSLDQWWLMDQTGDDVAVQLLSGGYVHPLMLVLRYRVSKRVCSLVLLPDSADRDMLRRLRVRLKQSKQPSM